MDDEVKSSNNRKNTVTEVTTIARNWFLSLSRKKKSTTNNKNNTNSNNQDDLDCSNRATSEVDLKKQIKSDTKKYQKDDNKNVFQRIKMKMEMRFPPMSRLFTAYDLTNDNDLKNKLDDIGNSEIDDIYSAADTTKPFTDSYRKYITEKWLGQDSGQNVIMYKACSEMLSHVWYWGEISRYDAQKQLTGKPNGSFLVRDSETNGSQFTLSFRIGNYTLHYRLQYRDNYWHFEELVYESIVEMIEDIMTRSTDEKFVCYVKAPSDIQPPIPVILKYPISRYSKIPQLQELCRRTIQEFIDPKKIEQLPIPVKLQQYLIEKASIIF